LDHEACYRAASSRDARFDGRFTTAVLTTGIYCRPSCPSRTPKAANVRFYPCPAAAQQDGFRACKRCRPDAAPGDPDWDRRADMVGRALRLIGDGVVDAEGVPGLARRLAVGERHLRRLFAAEVGAGPLAVAATQRLQLARALIEQSNLAITDVAFASGYASVRRFNDAMRTAFAVAPRDLRRTAAPAAGIVLQLPFRAPLDAEALLAWLAGHRTPGVEEVVGSTYRRVLGEHVAEADLSGARAGRRSVVLRIVSGPVAGIGPVVQRLRRLLDLDADPAAVADVLGADRDLGRLLADRPGIRVPGSVDGFETAVRAVLGQQVSVAGAGTLTGRLVRACGRPLAQPVGRLTHRFPTPAAVAAVDLSTLGLTGARRDAVQALAAAVADHRLVLDGSADREETVAGLLALPGIGPWTASIVASAALGDPDRLPAGDLGLRRALGLDERALAARADAWRPWRSYAAHLLWAQARPAGTAAPRPAAATAVPPTPIRTEEIR
jgi:AraC family transcriptional regulator of adaptative response / DNA-3-methyladenine glycosylase II